MDTTPYHTKRDKLIEYLQGLDSLLIAFSGGVDSTYLLAMAQQALGEKVFAVTADSSTYPKRELDEAVLFSQERGIRHIIFHSNEVNLPQVSANTPDRCYFCKRHLFEELKKIAKEKDIKNIAHAANLDDLSDYRPGFRAAKEMGILAPLIEVGLKKSDIRELSRELGLKTWDKPAMACLSSRIPYGEKITEKKLKMIEDAEAYLLKKGFTQYRVRYHGEVARVEVEKKEIKRIIEEKMSQAVLKRFREIGFLHVAVDLEGYVTGSMNRALKAKRTRR